MEKDGKRSPASAHTVQRPSDVVHQSCNLVASIRVQQFVMKGVRQFSGEFEATYRRGTALAKRRELMDAWATFLGPR